MPFGALSVPRQRKRSIKLKGIDEGRKEGWMDGWTDGRMDGWIKGGKEESEPRWEEGENRGRGVKKTKEGGEEEKKRERE